MAHTMDKMPLEVGGRIDFAVFSTTVFGRFSTPMMCQAVLKVHRGGGMDIKESVADSRNKQDDVKDRVDEGRAH